MGEIYKLKFGEYHNVNEFLDVLRVPGGWVYAFREMVDDNKGTEYFYQKVFVPFNNEFMTF